MLGAFGGYDSEGDAAHANSRRIAKVRRLFFFAVYVSLVSFFTQR